MAPRPMPRKMASWVLLQLRQHGGVHFGVEVKLHPELREHLDFAQAFDQGQLVLGDAVGVQPAGQGAGVVKVGADAAAAQFGGTGERGRPGADERDGAAGVGRRVKGRGRRWRGA